ncbi:MAG: hypothetical protein QNJ16_03720 [Rhodobacter sp.]|nr:hypothetical protein [Rhodobacter sp.]
MTRKLVALTTAAAISLAAAAPAVQAMDMEFNMLTGAVFNALKSRGIPTDNIDTLTLSEIAVIKGILDSDDSEGSKTQSIKNIVTR